MALHLLTSGQHSSEIATVTDRAVTDTSGPAVIVSVEADEVSIETLLAGRPQAYREPGSDWKRVGYEAADHWEQLTPEIRRRLLADSKAQLDNAEFRTATNGGSASIITNNWVYSGNPRRYRVAGQLRELVEALAQLGA